MSELKTVVTPKALPGTLTVDCASMASFLVDLPRGARSHLRSAQQGLELVLAEISANQTTVGERAGVTGTDFATLTTASDRIGMIDEQLPAARKLVELLEETRAYLEDQRQRQISAIATAVESRAKLRRSDELLALYERTREYHSAPGVRAWKTRRRNEAEGMGEPSEPRELSSIEEPRAPGGFMEE